MKLKLKERWCGLAFFVLFAAVLWLAFRVRIRNCHNCITDAGSEKFYSEGKSSFIATGDLLLHNRQKPQKDPRDTDLLSNNLASCTMDDCFNIDPCLSAFHVYVPSISSDRLLNRIVNPISELYQRVLLALSDKKYMTDDPSLACVFVLPYDTLDRDKRGNDFVKDLQAILNEGLNKFSWNNGTNYLVFNLFSGTWPDYNSMELGFDLGNALLAKASLSVNELRPLFDISLPLFQQEILDANQETEESRRLRFGADHSTYFLTFKGKRYVYGIGSEARNSLYHLHNNDSVLMLSTCRHGKNWQENQDERCDLDQAAFDKWDYKSLLRNSGFCLVPRGRRLGSFRFLEALQHGCIPVILSNEWELPFSEIIDWNAIVIWADERLLFQVYSMLERIPIERRYEMQEQALKIYEFYFSSVEKIVHTTLEIIKDRIRPWKARSMMVWNHGAVSGLHYDSDFSLNYRDFPFYRTFSDSGSPFVCVIIHYHSRYALKNGESGIKRFLKVVSQAKNVAKIIVLWDSMPHKPPRLPKWINKSVLVKVIKVNDPQSISLKYLDDFSTPGLIFLDANTKVTVDDLNFLIHVWGKYPSRLVGFFARSHIWSRKLSDWAYSSRISNTYSIITGSFFMVHRYYIYLLTKRYIHLQQLNGLNSLCWDLALNFLVADITQKPPIKVGLKKENFPTWDFGATLDYHKVRGACFSQILEFWGRNPLRHSEVRYDPVLFKDPVSNFRKKFRGMEDS